jgi:hypothetical protein
MTPLYTPEDHEAAARFFDEHIAPRASAQWIELNRDHAIREHARWCRFEREIREGKAERHRGADQLTLEAAE